MKTLSITAFNRPQYLKKVIKSLSKNNLTGYDKLYCGLEPGYQETIDICSNIKFIPTELIVNPVNFGVRKNPYELLNKIFQDNSEFNVYIEEDSLLSPDAISLANYHYDNFKDNKDILLCSFYNYFKQPSNYNTIQKSQLLYWNNFVAIGFSLFKYSWEEYMKPYWFSDEIVTEMGGKGIGWDWSVRASMKKHNLKVLTPSLPRSIHIGENGVHCSPRRHKQLFGGKKYSTENIGMFNI